MTWLKRMNQEQITRISRWLLVCTFGFLVPAAASAAPDPDSMQIQAGNYAGFGRLEFGLPEDATYEIVRESSRLLVVFRDAGVIVSPQKLPRNVLSIAPGPNSVRLRLKPGAEPISSRKGRTLIIDVLDPSSSGSRNVAEPTRLNSDRLKESGTAAPAPAPQNSLPPRKASLGSASPNELPPLDANQTATEPRRAVPVELASTPSIDPKPTLVTQPGDPTRDTLPTLSTASTAGQAVEASEIRSISKANEAEPAELFVIPAPADVGAAAFQRGRRAVIVLDRKLPLTNLPSGSQALPGSISTTVAVQLPEATDVRLTHVANGWSVKQVPAGRSTDPVVPTVVDGEVRLPLDRPGKVVTTLDPVTGGALLVGTSMGEGGKTGIRDLRHTPDYAILPSWLGVVVEPSSDRVDLRSVSDGFALIGRSPQEIATSSVSKHRFDIPTGSQAALLNRLYALLASAAASQPRSRTPDRTAAALTMIALGMGSEAQALMELIAADDPQAAADAQVVGLKAIAAVLAGRPAEAGGLDDPRLDGSDEIALWRGLRDDAGGLEAAADRKLADLSSLASSYPAALRRKIWPPVAEASVETGAPVAADKLSPFLLGRQFERAGRLDEALSAYQRAVAGPDSRDQVRAAERVTELQLASGKIGPAEAAAELERQAYAWRGDSREPRLRLRAAELLGVAGNWRSALEAMKATDAQFPDQHEAVAKGKAVILQEMLASDGSGMSALDVVLLAADYADRASPAGAQGAALSRLLADKLMALDLPARAIPVLQGLMKQAPAGDSRAKFAASLARLLLEGGNPSEALAVLDASSAPDLPGGLSEERGLLQARALAAQGQLSEAVKILTDQGTDAADDLRAKMLADAGDWHGSLIALKALAAKRVPASGPLPLAAQEVLVRQAAAAGEAKDQEELRALAPSATRLTAERADLFRMLTASPLSSLSDLPRAAQELDLTRGVAKQLSLGSKR